MNVESELFHLVGILFPDGEYEGVWRKNKVSFFIGDVGLDIQTSHHLHDLNGSVDSHKCKVIIEGTTRKVIVV
tara:strand:- start:2802 stop:3020 length:219 start_codon:yes stop_codon:yes gene_type:complete